MLASSPIFFFTNDSMIFGEATIERDRALKDLLDTYASSFRQLIIFDKSCTFFISNVNQDSMANVYRILDINSNINP